jgi:DNA-directed RNA polymerase subunit RPC12/RpoP
MAGETFSVTLRCGICGRSVTITNVTDAAQKEFKYYTCDHCGNKLEFRLSQVVVKHSGNVGANSKLTQNWTKGSCDNSTPS